MHGSSNPDSTVSRFRTEARLAVAALALLLAGHTSAGASGTQAEETKRQPVEYYVSSTCSGASATCVIPIVTTPSGKRKRLQVNGISCKAEIAIGEIGWLTVEDQAGVNPRYAYIKPEYTGTRSGDEIYVATSSNRYFLRRNETVIVVAVGNGNMTGLNCSLVGELVTY